MNRRETKIIIDAAMTVLMPILMAYSLVGETLHEVLGSLIFILFIAHHVMNRRSAAAAFRGRQTPVRVLQTVVNILLFIFMIVQPISGILMSLHLYTFLPTGGLTGLTSICRAVHLPLAYWGFVLISLHLGMHMDRMVQGQKIRKTPHTVLLSAAGLVSVYGIYAFIKRGFIGYMFLRTPFVFFDYSEPLVFFFLDYIAVMFLFAFIGYLVCLIGRPKPNAALPGSDHVTRSSSGRK